MEAGFGFGEGRAQAMRWFGRRGGRGEGLVTATEIACFAYCPEQWRLQYGLGLPAENQAALDL